MRSTQSLRLAQTINCPLCGADLCGDERRDSLMIATLIGAKAYKLCPACGDAVGDKTAESQEWHRKIDRYVSGKVKEGLRGLVEQLIREYPNQCGEAYKRLSELYADCKAMDNVFPKT